jgi:membrane protein DedA with SNARE-associated domain
VFLGRITPVMRSFISVPAGVFRARFGPYVWLTLAGSALWCFAFAAAGWAAGASWESFHHAFRFVDYVVALAVVVGAALLARTLLRRRRRSAADEPV